MNVITFAALLWLTMVGTSVVLSRRETVRARNVALAFNRHVRSAQWVIRK